MPFLPPSVVGVHAYFIHIDVESKSVRPNLDLTTVLGASSAGSTCSKDPRFEAFGISESLPVFQMDSRIFGM